MMKKIIYFPFFIIGLFSCDNQSIYELQEEELIIDINEVFRDREKEIITLPNRLQVAKVDSVYILDGDILLSEKQAMIMGAENSRSAVLEQAVNRWPGGIVFYSPSTYPVVARAIEMLEEKTNLSFFPRASII